MISRTTEIMCLSQASVATVVRHHCPDLDVESSYTLLTVIKFNISPKEFEHAQQSMHCPGLQLGDLEQKVYYYNTCLLLKSVFANERNDKAMIARNKVQASVND